MNKKKYLDTAKDVINLEIKALKKLKNNISSSLGDAVIHISKCQSKVVLCGVGKSGLIASKIASTLASVGTPAFSISASEASHGDLGMISKKDILVLLSNSGETNELKNVIQFANRNKVLLIGIVSKKDSVLYKASDIKILMPKVIEAGGIVPTSSTMVQLAIGDALSIASMKYKKFGKLDFKKLHPAGNLGSQLRTVEDIMWTGKKIPFVSEKLIMSKALNVLNEKKLGILIVQNKKKITRGIITDGQIRRFNKKHFNLRSMNAEKIMTKNPIGIEKNELAAKALSLMNTKKITSLHVYSGKNKLRTIGVIHIHDILKSNIS